MGRKGADRELEQRIQSGEIRRQDVNRRLAELAFGKVNDCVRLVLEEQPALDGLDLSLLSEVKKSEKGMVEIKLIDRMQVLQQLREATVDSDSEMGAFLQALQGGEKE